MMALVIAVALATISYFLFNALGMSQMPAKQIFVNGIALGAFLGILLSAIFSRRHPAMAAAETGEAGEAKTIFVGNLAFKANSEQLRELFGKYGSVNSVRIMTDRMTRRPRGFAFIEMEGHGALQAISALDGADFMGRPLRVNEGHERSGRSDQQEQES